MVKISRPNTRRKQKIATQKSIFERRLDSYRTDVGGINVNRNCNKKNTTKKNLFVSRFIDIRLSNVLFHVQPLLFLCYKYSMETVEHMKIRRRKKTAIIFVCTFILFFSKVDYSECLFKCKMSKAKKEIFINLFLVYMINKVDNQYC